jgi:hypothetical protein
MRVKTMRLAIFLVAVLLVSASIPAQEADSRVDFINNYIQVRAGGAPAAGEREEGVAFLQARRSAVVEAQRMLAEAALGVQIDSQSANQMSRLAQDNVTSAVRGGVRTCLVVETDEKLMADFARTKIVSLTCRAPLTGSNSILSAMVDAIAPEIRKKIDDQKLVVYTPVSLPAPTAPTRGTAPAPFPGATMAQADFDGLILRVPASFKPSVYPKIRTDKGEVVYSMKDVSLEIQKNRGIATYTDDSGKATASLRALGSTNILTIDASLYIDTEAQVKIDDAAKIATSNKKTSFLNSGRVVFVVGKVL